MIRIFFFIFIFSLTAFSETTEGNSVSLIRLSSINLEIANTQRNVDVINMFSNHLQLEASEIKKDIKFELGVSFFNKFSLLYTKHLFEYSVDTSNLYSFDTYSYEDKIDQISLQIALFGAIFRLGKGKRLFNTFLETDTSFYYHREVDTYFTSLSFDYIYNTSTFFNINIFFEKALYDSKKMGDIEVDEGDWSRFGLRFPIGDKLQVVPFIERTYHNIKLIHHFFGLRNEMNNKSFFERLGIRLNYYF